MICPKGFICINNLHFMYIAIILIGVFYLHSNDNLKLIHKNTVEKERIIEKQVKPKTKEIIKEIIIPQPVYNNIDRINNPLQPPLKREPSLMPINIKTRGDGGPYQQLGTVFKKTNIDETFGTPGNNDKNIILSLYGKPTYLGSRHFNYYTISKDGVKIPLKLNNTNCTDDRGCEEINDGQEITIPEYNGTFTANIYKNESPRYIPYI